MIRKNIHLTKNQVEQINKKSKIIGISSAEYIRRIIDSYFECKDSEKSYNPSLEAINAED